MNFNFTNLRPSHGQRFTALFAVVMVMLLVVFSASPNLHAWLHSHDGTVQQGAVAGNNQKGHGQDDEDSCAIVLFGNGVIASALVLFAAAAIWRLINLVVIGRTEVFRHTARYWLPPLCGPPLS